MRIKSTALMASILAVIAGQSLAYETGDIVVRAGAALVSPDVSDNTAIGVLDVDSNVQLGLTGTYFLAPTLGVQLLAATPFKHDITAAGTEIGSTKQLPPTVTLQWYPAISETVHPYIGAGINYTVFFEDDIPGADLDLSSSVGLALEAGVDIKLTEKLLLNVAVWKIDINTDVKVDGVNYGELEIDPLAAMVGIGYKF